MRHPLKYVFGAAAILALASTGNLALAQQPATTPPAPAAGAQDQPSGTSTMPPGHMEHEKGMDKMGHGKDMGSTTSGQAPSPMGGMPSCPSGQTASGTPSTCK